MKLFIVTAAVGVLVVFSVVQAIPYKPTLGQCQSLGDNGIIYERCLPSTGPWIHPNAAGPLVTGIPLDKMYWIDLDRGIALQKKIEAAQRAATNKFEYYMKNLIRPGSALAEKKVIKILPRQESQEYSSGGSTQVNLVQSCNYSFESLCKRFGCYWDKTAIGGRGRCKDSE